MNADVEKAVEYMRDVLKFGADRTKAEFERMAQALRDQEAEIARLDASESQLIDERDRAHDALQRAHIELGGDGEWTCKMGAAADYPPDSGDLHDDVPALASEVRARAEKAEALLRDAQAVIDDYLPDHPRDAAFDISTRITAHLGAEQ